jgi:hypothetical protein
LHANHLALACAGANAKRLGQSRRDFLVSSAGAASTLLAMNAAYAAAGKTGGFYDIPAEAALDQQLARAKVTGNEFIFDVQGHFVNPTGAWTKLLPPAARPLQMPKTQACGPTKGKGQLDYLQCIGQDEFLKDVFLDSDTDLMVLSFVPSTREREPLTIEEAFATSRIVEKMQGTHRLYIHGRVNPNQAGDLEGMDELAAKYPISAWKTYTQWGPDGTGFWMDDDVGLRFIEKARKLGIRNIAIHKGLSFGPRSYEHSTCADIGRVAKRFPDVNFLIYHSSCAIPRLPRMHWANSSSSWVLTMCCGARIPSGTARRRIRSRRSARSRYPPPCAISLATRKSRPPCAPRCSG